MSNLLEVLLAVVGTIHDNAKGSLLAQLGLSLNLSKKRYAFEPTEP